MGNAASDQTVRIMNAIDELRTLVLDLSAPKAQTVSTQGGAQGSLVNLLDRLQQFGSAQIDYFTDHIPVKNAFREYPIAATIGQISNDLEVIERVALQRSASAAPLLSTLQLADQFCYQALLPARALLEPNFTTTAYLQKMPLIRVIPYAPVALIGVPYTTINSAPPANTQETLGLPTACLDFLATPHEAGHYVFFHGYVKSEDGTPKPLMIAIIEALKDKTPTGRLDVRRWKDEIFADVYASLIAGPVMAVDFQDLELNSSMGGFTEDDGDHPIPLLRPEVYRLTLEAMGLNDYAAAVKERWDKKVANRPYLPRVFDGDSVEPLDQLHALADLKTVVDAIHNLLVSSNYLDLYDSKSGKRRWWLSDAPLPALNRTEVGTLLYDDFVRRVLRFSDYRELPPIAAKDPTQTWTAGFIRDANQGRAAGMEFRPILSGLTPDQLGVLWARGWASDGPQTQWP
jgi:hypothetical protein